MKKPSHFFLFFAEKISNQKKFLQYLKQKGFNRLLFPKEKILNLSQVRDIEDIKRLSKKDFYLLLDRFVIEEKQKERLRDSFKQAFDLPKMLTFDSVVFSEEIVVQILNGEKRSFSKQARCPQCTYEFPRPLTASLFSFNSPLGACSDCEGYGYKLEVDEYRVVPNPRLSLKKGAIHPFQHPSAAHWKSHLKQYCEKKNIPWDKAWCDLLPKQRQNLWRGQGSFKGVEGYFQKLELKRYKMHIRILLFRYKSPFTCKTCNGSKLRSDLNFILFHGKNFNDYMKMNLGQMKRFFDKTEMSPFGKGKMF